MRACIRLASLRTALSICSSCPITEVKLQPLLGVREARECATPLRRASQAANVKSIAGLAKTGSPRTEATQSKARHGTSRSDPLELPWRCFFVGDRHKLICRRLEKASKDSSSPSCVRGPEHSLPAPSLSLCCHGSCQADDDPSRLTRAAVRHELVCRRALRGGRVATNFGVSVPSARARFDTSPRRGRRRAKHQATVCLALHLVLNCLWRLCGLF